MTELPEAADEMLRAAFVFIPHGAPEPEAWHQAHPQSFSVPARLVRRAGQQAAEAPVG